MIRSYKLVFLLLFCIMPAHGMEHEKVAVPDTNIVKAIGNDILRGGLILPGLFAAGIKILSDEKVRKDIKMHDVTGYTACVMAMGLVVVGVPIMCKLAGTFLCNVEPRGDITAFAHWRDYREMVDAYNCQKIFRLWYGVVSFLLMAHAVDIILYGIPH